MLLVLNKYVICGNRPPWDRCKVLYPPSSSSRVAVAWQLGLLSSLFSTFPAAYHRVCLRMPAFIYLIFYSISFQKAHGPQGRDHFLWCASDAGFCPCTGTSRHNWQRNNHHLPAKEMVISLGRISNYQHSLEKYCWPLQEPAWKGGKARTAHPQVRCRNPQRSEFSLTVYPPFSSSLHGKIDCIDYFTDVYPVPFTFGSQKQQSFWEMRGACDANQCVQCKLVRTPLTLREYLPGGDGAPKAGFSCGSLHSQTP